MPWSPDLRVRASAALAAATLLATLGAAGCGGGSDPSAGGTGDVPAAADPAEAPAPSSPQPAGEPAPPEAPEPVKLAEIAVADQPIDLTTRAGDGRLFVAEKTGRVRTLDGAGQLGAQPFLDIADRISSGGERGLLGIAFSPDGSRLYAHYSDANGDGVLASWSVATGEVDLSAEVVHATVAQPYPNHNGGQIRFGPDGYLYWALGDGGAAGDPENRAQDLTSPLGKLLRIEPTLDGYAVPPDNPFVDEEGARPEIWLWGLRNPWRFAFDRDGGIWIGDVGQGELEEIDYLPAEKQAGANLGWDLLEGTRPFEGELSAELVPPVFEYSHDRGASVTGGVVYRGSAIPSLRGTYLFGDYGSGFVSGLAAGERGWVELPLGVEVPSLAAFGEDQDGEVYLLSLDGPIYRLVPAG